jgi:hypothetical protein
MMMRSFTLEAYKISFIGGHILQVRKNSSAEIVGKRYTYVRRLLKTKEEVA